MESKKIFNTMGNEVVAGFDCKPKDFDPNRPMMHFKTQIFICDDERCSGAHKKENKAKELREILKQMNLEKGKNRIKIVRTKCFGACRFRAVANIYENSLVNSDMKNNAIFLKGVHNFDKEKWKTLFTNLSQNKMLDDEIFKKIPISVIEEIEDFDNE